MGVIHFPSRAFCAENRQWSHARTRVVYYDSSWTRKIAPLCLRVPCQLRMHCRIENSQSVNAILPVIIYRKSMCHRAWITRCYYNIFLYNILTISELELYTLLWPKGFVLLPQSLQVSVIVVTETSHKELNDALSCGIKLFQSHVAI